MLQPHIRKNDHESKDAFDEDYEPRSHIFHKLMQFKVKKILLVSSLYDAFIIEEEGLIPELVIGEYSHLDLSSPPHVFRVSSGEKALEYLPESSFDLVITMAKNIGMDPFEFGSLIKLIDPDIPVILLATDTSDILDIRDRSSIKGIDKIFFWNGDSNLFIAIIKYIEDRINARYDTIHGNVGVIIVVEDSVRYYSMFLPIIYAELVQQTQRLISEDLNEMQRRLRMRVRPKVLLAEDYEEGMRLYDEYKDHLLGIVSDVNFRRNGSFDMDAGYSFASAIKRDAEFLPILLQSSKLENMERAQALGAFFLHKLSPTLLQDFRHFLLDHLGFGDFIFLLPKEDAHALKDRIVDVDKEDGEDEKISGDGWGQDKEIPQVGRRPDEDIFGDGGRPDEDIFGDGGRPDEEPGGKTKDWLHEETIELGRASDTREFEKMIQKIPTESIRFHGDRNNFSNWLMARGEFKLAMELRPRSVSEFGNPDEMREYLVKVFKDSRREKQLGVITDFGKQTFEFESIFSRLGGGSLGGKGRGIAFMRSVLTRFGLENKYKDISISIPNTVVIGTEEFDLFIVQNELRKYSEVKDVPDEEIAEVFMRCSLPQNLTDKLRILIDHFRFPLAVRSSSLLEDSQNYPFAGIYSTYMIPNNHESDELRLNQLSQAIKLVYASMFFSNARRYIKSTSSKVEEEKMAVIIQELVGIDYGGRFYPHFSGVAQSYNFYPVSHQSYEDGIVSVAVGLGKAVVGGEKALRFSPKYPTIIPEFFSPENTFENSQKDLYILNMDKKEFQLSENEEVTLAKLNVADIMKDNTLETIASTYDYNNGIIRDTIDFQGPKLITFSGILKYNTFPLAPLLSDVLSIGERSMGCPVEIEFAVILKQNGTRKPSFSILQIRPIVTSHEHCDISRGGTDNTEEIFLHSDKALGNGIISNIRDIVYVPPETFDLTKTVRMAGEVERLNDILSSESRPYLLMGPGRWGTEDHWLGIPVNWGQISGVKVVVETGLKELDVEPSQGTHFFQNMISRKIGYINIPYKSKHGYLDWDWLHEQNVEHEMEFVRHVSLPSPLTVKLDGRCGGALILKNETIE